MARPARWSPDVLFEEVPGSADPVMFRYPAKARGLARLAAVFALAGAAAAALSLLPSPLASRVGLPAAAVALALGAWAAVDMTRTVWTARTMELDLARRALARTVRSPFGLRRESLPFEEIVGVRLVEEDAPGTPAPDRATRVVLDLRSGGAVDLGRDRRVDAIAFGRRLAGTVGAPVRVPPIV